MALAALLLTFRPATALGPHELLLLVNENSHDSLTLANHYIALREIPLRNVVYLDLADAALAPESEFSRERFTREIWAPAQAAMEERGLRGHVTAWVFSAGFPTRIATDPKMSIHGLTFTRNEPPESDAIRLGQYPSPLFRGPTGPNAPTGPSLSLEQFSGGLGDRMPLPAMTLAHTGARGCRLADAVNRLEKSAMADATRPDGTINFMINDDVRSKTRQWQYAPAVAELDDLGIAATVTEQLPDGSPPVAGLMMGSAQVNPGRIAQFAPGAMSDHLTSWAGYFDQPGQTKLTAWLQAGAAASAGTVTEPLSVWTKFPAARFFAHYGRGCTLLESFYQSVASPVQLLMVGDPLLAPWKPDLSLSLVEEAPGPEGERLFRARLEPEQPADYVYLLDGRLLSPMVPDAAVRFPAGPFQDRHRLRVVAYTRGPIRHQAFTEIELTPDPSVSSPTLRISGSDADRHDGTHPFEIELAGDDGMLRIRLYAQGREIGAIDGSGPGTVTVDPQILGAGPINLEAIAEATDGTVRRSAPHMLTLADAPPAHPEFERIAGETAGVSVGKMDPTPWTWTWLTAIAPATPDPADAFRSSGEGETDADAAGRITLSPADRNSALLLLAESDRDGAEVMLAPPRGARGEAGLVVRATGEENYIFFGWEARRSAWVVQVKENGQTRRLATRGAPTPRPNEWFRLEVTGLSGDLVTFRVDGAHIAEARIPRPRLRRRDTLSAGVRAAAADASFQRLLQTLGEAEATGDAPVRFEAPDGHRDGTLWLRGALGSQAVYQKVEP